MHEDIDYRRLGRRAPVDATRRLPVLGGLGSEEPQPGAQRGDADAGPLDVHLLVDDPLRREGAPRARRAARDSHGRQRGRQQRRSDPEVQAPAEHEMARWRAVDLQRPQVHVAGRDESPQQRHNHRRLQEHRQHRLQRSLRSRDSHEEALRAVPAAALERERERADPPGAHPRQVQRRQRVVQYRPVQRVTDRQRSFQGRRVEPRPGRADGGQPILLSRQAEAERGHL